jgi:hypothetical protein
MTTPHSITVNLADEYPIFKQDGDLLVSLPKRNEGRRYSLTSNAQTGETYYIEYTDQDEAEADLQMGKWEADAPKREIEAKRQEDEAKKFEESLQYQDRLVAFLDILGWKQAVLSEGNHVVKMLGKILAQMQGVTSHFNSLRNLVSEDQKWPGDPVMTQFSDCLVFSAESNSHGREALENALSILTSNLMQFRFLLRGGITRGQLFHDSGLVYGPALIKAYELENELALYPRVILSNELSLEWESRGIRRGTPWIKDFDGYLFFNFLPPFMGSPFFTDQKLWQSRLTPIRELILSKASDPDCDEKVYAKYAWLAYYFDRVCDEYPEIELEKVRETAMNIRSGKWDDKV